MSALRTVILAVAVLSRLVLGGEDFPPELVQFVPYDKNPVFTAEGPGHWDVKIRERGWILREGDAWRLWFTGYDGTTNGKKLLGHATSTDGVHWTRDAKNPIHREHWVEDMMVVRDGSTYFMFAEGERDQAELLTSPDGVEWTWQGHLDVRKADGAPIPLGPYGTPTAWKEGEVWHLFYERMDQGVWLATSRDRKVWTNVSDEPVLKPGPDAYDGAMVAFDQIVRHEGKYYAYYHGRGADSPNWCSCIAVSTDLKNWTKYPKNPLLPREHNRSSPQLVHDGKRFVLYTMHDRVDRFLPAVKQ